MTETTTARGRKLLEQCPLFAEIDERSRRELVAHALPRSFGAGEPICHLGDAGPSMMAVVVGTVRISLPTVKGKEIILADLPAGELFGEIAMLDGKSRSANATALTNCELLVLERRQVIPFLEVNPAACLKLMEMLCGRIRRSDERMADIAFFDLPTRLAKVILNYPAKAHGATRLSLSQRELADMAGGTRENVNRCLRDWRRRGIVATKDGWTTVLNAEELRRLVSGSSNKAGLL
jgi:CRP/FNR family transcriptional regulator, cyclic AMP receptor protein